jgi:hypothetical protein
MTDDCATKPLLQVLRDRYLTEAGRCHATMLRASAENKPGEQSLEMGKESAYRAAASIIPTVFDSHFMRLLERADTACHRYFALKVHEDEAEAWGAADDAWDDYVQACIDVFGALMGDSSPVTQEATHA